MIAASAQPVRGARWNPQAASAAAQGSAQTTWRPGNQKPNIVGERNAAATICAAQTAASSAAAASAVARSGSARATRSRRERHSSHTANPASASTGAQRRSP